MTSSKALPGLPELALPVYRLSEIVAASPRDRLVFLSHRDIGSVAFADAPDLEFLEKSTTLNVFLKGGARKYNVVTKESPLIDRDMWMPLVFRGFVEHEHEHAGVALLEFAAQDFRGTTQYLVRTRISTYLRLKEEKLIRGPSKSENRFVEIRHPSVYSESALK
jgi:hypothetical protein